MMTQQESIQKTFGNAYVIDNHEGVSEPIVSIIIPTMNCLAFLPKAIKSIQCQGVDAVEIIIIDDGSTDESWKYLNLAAYCDKRIRAFNVVNGGVAKARNFAINKAKAQYIAFLDADDYWLAGKLQKQITFHQQHPEVTLSFCNYVHFNDENAAIADCFDYWPLFNKYIQQSQQIGYQVIPKQGAAMIYAENVIGTSGVLLNTKAIDFPVQFDENLSSAEDWDLWLKIALCGPIGFTTNVDFAYLMRANSESSNIKLRLLQIQAIMKRYAKAVFTVKPIALIQCTSRLFIGYAEYHRNTSFTQQQSTHKFTNVLLSCGCHSMAFLLSPSVRVLKAALSDVKNLIMPCKA